MVSTRRYTAGCLAALALVSLVSCEKKQALPDAGVKGFLQSAIYGQGGLDKVKKASSFSASYEATVGGIKISRGKAYHRPGVLRVEYKGPTRDRVVQVTSEKSCWQTIGSVVLPCLESLRKHTTRLSQLLEASWLWPVAGRDDRQLEIEPMQGGAGAAGKERLKLTVKDASGELIGTLLINGETFQVVGLEMQTTLGGKTGAFVGTFGTFEKACGMTVATERRYTFAGEPFATEKLTGVICEKLDDKLFVKPDQVKHRKMDQKIVAANGLVCTKLKGALSGVDAALAKVMDRVQMKNLTVTGAAVLIHRKGPPQVKRPAQYVTDVCLPVGKQDWLKQQLTSEWKGAFFLREIADQRVVTGYGIGDLEKTTAELPALLLAEAKQLGHTPDPPMYQFVYMRAADFPPEQRVSEMHLPVVE